MLVAAKSPGYDELINISEKYLALKKSTLVVQYYFLSTYQCQESLITKYAAVSHWDIAVWKDCSKNVSIANISLWA